MTGAGELNVMLNGRPRRVSAPATVASVVSLLDVAPDARGVAVAVDGEVVARSAWERTEVHDGAAVEDVAAIQGG